MSIGDGERRRFVLGRRAFVTALGGTLLLRPFPARTASDHGARTVGVMMGLANDQETQARSNAFEEGLRREGWTIGRDLHLEYRFANGDDALMLAFAKELVAQKCDCIVGHSTPVVAALMKATRTIPIVFVAVSDPIGSGFVASMARPGGNVTGFSILQPTITGKDLSLLRELRAQVTRVALMYNPESVPGAGEFFTRPFLDSAADLNFKPILAEVHSSTDIESAIEQLGAEPGGALITVPDNFLSLHRQEIIEFTAKYSVPTVYPYRYFAEAGGLLSYGVDAINLFQRATDYVDRILRGAKPADLPVQGPTKFELVINIGTARTLGLVVPKILLAGADAVVE
jgi:putative tryptophan/tyrosine transport system substrate-binding protein